MSITEEQLAERAATKQAIEHLKAAIELLKPLQDEASLFEVIIDDLLMDIDTLDEVYAESFINAGEEG